MSGVRRQPPPPPSLDIGEEGAAATDDEGSDSYSDGSFSSGSGSAGGGATKKPAAFQRTWAPADEISLLEAVVSHRQRHGRIPSPDDLAAALRGSLLTTYGRRLDADAVSLRLRYLRSRYIAAWRRISFRGVVPVKDHDLRIYKLSKSIWEEATRDQRISKKPSVARNGPPREPRELEALYPCLSAVVDAVEASRPCAVVGMLRRSFGRIGDEKAAQLEAKARKQRLAEVKVGIRLAMLRKEVSDTLLELIESND
uniref:Glabrous enhancer-binding protein-like DBD domain-containing protein n=1 Tax=Leersia perrieri TaxID=77586 RepID=A0A0D9WQ81_9ORYZ